MVLPPYSPSERRSHGIPLPVVANRASSRRWNASQGNQRQREFLTRYLTPLSPTAQDKGLQFMQPRHRSSFLFPGRGGFQASQLVGRQCHRERLQAGFKLQDGTGAANGGGHFRLGEQPGERDGAGRAAALLRDLLDYRKDMPGLFPVVALSNRPRPGALDGLHLSAPVLAR